MEKIEEKEIDVLNVLIAQAFEESRYHRRVHHLIFTVAVSLYSALLGFQLAYPIDTTKYSTGSVAILVLLLFLILPGYFSWYVLHRHRILGKVNFSLACLADRLALLTTAKTITASDGVVWGVPVDSLKKFVAFHYKEPLERGDSIMTVGNGHWFYLAVLVSLFFSNGILFAAHIP